MRPRRGDVQLVSRLLVQDGTQAAQVEPALVRVRSPPSLPRLLRRQARVACVGARLPAVPVDPGRVRRSPPDSPKSKPDADILRQDDGPNAVPDGAQSGVDANMDRRGVHWGGRLPAFPVAN